MYLLKLHAAAAAAANLIIFNLSITFCHGAHLRSITNSSIWHLIYVFKKKKSKDRPKKNGWYIGIPQKSVKKEPATMSFLPPSPICSSYYLSLKYPWNFSLTLKKQKRKINTLEADDHHCWHVLFLTVTRKKKNNNMMTDTIESHGLAVSAAKEAGGTPRNSNPHLHNSCWQ